MKSKEKGNTKRVNNDRKREVCGAPLLELSEFALDVMHDSNPRSWEVLVGGHKFESSLRYKGRSCLKGEKKTENRREGKGWGEE